MFFGNSATLEKDSNLAVHHTAKNKKPFRSDSDETDRLANSPSDVKARDLKARDLKARDVKARDVKARGAGKTAFSARFHIPSLNGPRPLPPKPTHVHTSKSGNCPYCNQPKPADELTIWKTLTGGIRRLFGAIFMIVSALIRTVRMIVAGALGIIALIGGIAHRVALAIAHPNDRRYLRAKWPNWSFRLPFRRDQESA